jgi:alkylation response protein AidB-like acyl-CoA dehydrogenase
VSYYRRIIGLGLTKQIQDIVGLAALTDDPQWGAMDGFAEAHQRSAIVAMHPGGTTDIQRVIMARRLGIGNRSREQAGQLAPAAAPSA